MKHLGVAIDEPTLVAYYCRNCDKVVKGVSKGKQQKYSFSCPDCQGDCFYGTARSLIHFLKIKENSENGQALVQMQKDKLKDLGLTEKAE
ncbi:MAG: hypothetical protein AB7J40_05670 [Candidatus Altimarinota bacterium]